MSNEVYLEDDEPDIVKNMVEFLYTTDYNDRRSASKCDLDQKADDLESTVPEAPEEDIIIDTGPIEVTENSAVNSLEYNPQSLVTNAKMYIIADKNEIEALKKLASTKYKQVVPKCWNDLAFAESARLIYENTTESDRTVKDIIIQAASDNIKALLDRDEFTEVLNSYGELATSILKRVVASNKPASGFDFAGSSDWGMPMYSKGKKKNRY
jgi:hypothetical protein